MVLTGEELPSEFSDYGHSNSELEEAILVLGLDQVLELLVVLKGLLVRGWDLELATRVLLAAVRPNLPQLLGSAVAAPVIHAIAPLLSKRMLELKVSGHTHPPDF